MVVLGLIIFSIQLAFVIYGGKFSRFALSGAWLGFALIEFILGPVMLANLDISGSRNWLAISFMSGATGIAAFFVSKYCEGPKSYLTRSKDG